jgi:hypothetical protein
MFRSPVETTNTSSGSDANNGVNTYTKVPRVAGKIKRDITARLRRALSDPNLSPSELSPPASFSQAAIMKGLGSGLTSELRTPYSALSDTSDSDAELFPAGDSLFTELDVPHDLLLQSEDSRRSSAGSLFATVSPTASPSSVATANVTLGDMPELIITSLSPALVPASKKDMSEEVKDDVALKLKEKALSEADDNLATTPPAVAQAQKIDLTIESAASAVQQKDVLEEIKHKITENLKETITENLKEKIKSDDHHVPEDNGYTRRAVSHVIEETIEVIAWTPKKSKKSTPVSSDDVQSESKMREPNVFIHYKNPFYDIMNTAAQLSGQYEYDPKRVFHKHQPDLPSRKKVNQLPKALDGTKPTHEQFKNMQQLLEGGKAIIPICIGFDGALTGAELEKVLKFYSDNKVAEIVVYIGEYNRLEDPEEQLERIGREKRVAWQAENQAILDRYKAKILLREELVKTDVYIDAKKFVSEKLNHKELKFSSVSAAAQKYMDGRGKPSTSTPKLSAQNGDAGIVSQLMLSSDEQDDKDMKQFSVADAQFKAVAEATVKAAIEHSADRVRDGARFLAEFRAAMAAENGSVFRQHTMFSSSAPKSKQKKKAQHISDSAQQQSQSNGNGGPRMSPGSSASHD